MDEFLDCTSEALNAALGLRQFSFITPLEEHRYFESVNVILSLQNKDGGWPTYELKRAGNWVEYLNPSEVFCMYQFLCTHHDLTSR